jgi:PEP-CTERM motif
MLRHAFLTVSAETPSPVAISASVALSSARSNSLRSAVDFTTGTAPFSGSTGAYFDDGVVFSADPSVYTDSSANVQLLLAINGKTNATAEAAASALFFVQLFGQQAIEYTVSDDAGRLTCSGIAAAAPSCAVDMSGILTGVTLSVPLNAPVRLYMEIDTGSSVESDPGFDASANSEWGDTMSLNRSEVFVLPDGVTVNAPDSNIVDNHFVAASEVPEPSSLTILGAGLIAWRILRRRRETEVADTAKV